MITVETSKLSYDVNHQDKDKAKNQNLPNKLKIEISSNTVVHPRKYGKKNSKLGQNPQIFSTFQTYSNNTPLASNTYTVKKEYGRQKNDFNKRQQAYNQFCYQFHQHLHPGYTYTNHTKKDLSDPRKDLSDRLLAPYNRRISAAATKNNADECLNILNEITDKAKLVPDAFSYNVILNLFVNQGDIPNAVLLFEAMKQVVKPDVITYTTMMKLYDLRGVLSLMEEMKVEGVKPNVVVYAMLLQHYVNKIDLAGARALMEKMKNEGIKPDGKIYRLFLDLLVKVDHLDEAKSLYKEYFLLDNSNINNQELNVQGLSLYEMYSMKYFLKKAINEKFKHLFCEVEENKEQLKISKDEMALKMPNVNGSDLIESTHVEEQNSSKDVPQVLEPLTENNEEGETTEEENIIKDENSNPCKCITM